MARGYFGIGVWHSKSEVNIGTLWRSAYSYGAAFIFTIGRRYKQQPGDTTKTWRHIPLLHYADLADFKAGLPFECRIVGIENCEEARDLDGYHHPERCVYLLGAEDHGLSAESLAVCHDLVRIVTPLPHCLNVAVAGSIVLASRRRQAV